MSDTKPPDYKAEAQKLAEEEFPPQHWDCTEVGNRCHCGAQEAFNRGVLALAVLLERLCGEAREEQKAKDGWLGCGCRSAFVNPTCTMHTRIRPAFFVDGEA